MDIASDALREALSLPSEAGRRSADLRIGKGVLFVLVRRLARCEAVCGGVFCPSLRKRVHVRLALRRIVQEIGVEHVERMVGGVSVLGDGMSEPLSEVDVQVVCERVFGEYMRRFRVFGKDTYRWDRSTSFGRARAEAICRTGQRFPSSAGVC